MSRIPDTACARNCVKARALPRTRTRAPNVRAPARRAPVTRSTIRVAGLFFSPAGLVGLLLRTNPGGSEPPPLARLALARVVEILTPRVALALVRPRERGALARHAVAPLSQSLMYFAPTFSAYSAASS